MVGAPPMNGNGTTTEMDVGRKELESRGKITNYFCYTPQFKHDVTLKNTKKFGLDDEKEDLGNV